MRFRFRHSEKSNDSNCAKSLSLSFISTPTPSSQRRKHVGHNVILDCKECSHDASKAIRNCPLIKHTMPTQMCLRSRVLYLPEPRKFPSMHGRTNWFLPGIFWKHRLTNEDQKSCLCHLETWITHGKSLGENLFTNPTSFVGLGEKLHISVGKMRTMMRVEDENAGLFSLRFGVGRL